MRAKGEAIDTDTDMKITVALSSQSGMAAQAVANRDKLLQAYRAIESGDDAALITLLDPDVCFYEAPSLPYGVAAKGIPDTLKGVAAMAAAWSRIRVEVEEFTAAGDLVIAYLRFTGTARHTAIVYEGVCAEVFRFRQGLITEWRPVYWDTHAARAACSGSLTG